MLDLVDETQSDWVYDVFGTWIKNAQNHSARGSCVVQVTDGF